LDVPSWVGFGDYMQRSGSDSQPDYVQQTSAHPGAMRRIAIAATLKTDDEMLFKSLAMVKFLLLMDLTATSLGDVLAGLVMQVGGEETVTQVLRIHFRRELSVRFTNEYPVFGATASGINNLEDATHGISQSRRYMNTWTS